MLVTPARLVAIHVLKSGEAFVKASFDVLENTVEPGIGEQIGTHLLLLFLHLCNIVVQLS